MTDKKQGYQPETVIATNPPNCGSGITPPNNGRFVINIPADGNYIEILGHRIDGFESFEAFCEHLKKYAELEETVKIQKAEIERLKTHLEELADEVEDKMTYMCGCKNCIETVKRIIKDDVKPFDMYCDSCNRCKHRETEAVKEFAERFIQEDGYNNHIFDDCASILVPEEYRKGREEKIKEVWELIKEIKKEMVGDTDV